jgi:hypothetical protein
MKRSDAAELVGRRVSAWTAANGTYCGTLVEVTRDRPWRARVLVDGVLGCGVHFEHWKPIYGRGKQVGQVIEVGGSSVEITDANGYGDYNDAVIAAATTFELSHANYLAGKFGPVDNPRCAALYGWHGRAAEVYRKVAEVRRGLEPLERLMATPEGVMAVRAAVRQMAEEGLLPGREHLRVSPEYDWESIARTLIRDEAVAGHEPCFRNSLLTRLDGHAALEPQDRPKGPP